MSNNDTTSNTKEKEQGKKKKVPQPLEERSLPSGVVSPVTREKLPMAKGKPQKTGMTVEINSNPTCAI
jgi:hypothetical protein